MFSLRKVLAVSVNNFRLIATYKFRLFLILAMYGLSFYILSMESTESSFKSGSKTVAKPAGSTTGSIYSDSLKMSIYYSCHDEPAACQKLKVKLTNTFYNALEKSHEDLLKLVSSGNCVAFYNVSNPEKYEYEIFVNSDVFSLNNIWKTSLGKIKSSTPERNKVSHYQHLINEALYNLRFDENKHLPKIIYSFYGGQTSDGFLPIFGVMKEFMSSSFITFLFFGFIFSILNGIFSNVYREDCKKKLMQGMLLTGLSKVEYWCGMMLTYSSLILLFSCFCIIPLILFPLEKAFYSHGLCFFIILSSGIYSFCFSLLLVYCVKNETLANSINSLVFSIWPCLCHALLTRFGSAISLDLANFFCITPAYLAVLCLVGDRLSPGDSMDTVIYRNIPSIQMSIVWLFIACLCIILFIIYVEYLTISDDYRRSLFYPIFKLFKGRSKKVAPTSLNEDGVFYEQDDCDKPPAIELVDISKKYEGSKTFSVQNINLKVYKGEIFALLGHNGSGKSTTINLMLGLYSTTSGDIFIDGINMKKERKKLSKYIGICPQQDILYDDLTGYQHLKFFGQIRGLTKEEINESIRNLESELAMEKFLYKPTKVLSGGEKRKVCIAIAFVGKPKYVILDEPSSGMDPNSRKFLWEFLKRKKTDMAIIICTHFMDEADLLADRKALLVAGKVKCVGSSDYIKKVCNIGFEIGISALPGYDSLTFIKFAASQGIDCTLSKHHGNDYDYSIKPKEGVENGRIIVEFLSSITTHQADLYIDRYDFIQGSLDQLFFQISDEREGKLKSAKVVDLDESSSGRNFDHLKPVPPIFPLMEMIAFRIRNMISDFVASFSQLSYGLPTLILSVTLYFMFINTPSTAPIPINQAFYESYMPSSKFTLFGVNDIIAENYLFMKGDLANLDKPVAEWPKNSPGYIKLEPTHYRLNIREGYPLSLLYAVKVVSDIKIQATNQPFQIETKLRVVNSNIEKVVDTIFAFVFPFSLLVFSIGSIFNPVIDSASREKQSIKFSMFTFGINPIVYWLSFFFQTILLSAPMMICFGVFTATMFKECIVGLGISADVHLMIDTLSRYMVLYFFFMMIFSCCVATYFSANTARTLLNVLNNYSFILLPLLSLTFFSDDLDSKSILLIITALMPAFPLICLPLKYVIDPMSQGIPSVFSENIEADMFTLIGCLSAVFFMLLFIKEYSHSFLGLFKTIKYAPVDSTESETVKREREKAFGYTDDDNDSLLVKGVSVNYHGGLFGTKKFNAVKNVCLSSVPGEILAFLGSNGAGKSTLLKCILTQLQPETGIISLEGDDVNSFPYFTLPKMGYCPQFDTNLVEDMTARQHFYMYGSMIGYTRSQIKGIVSFFGKELLLTEYLDVKVKAYSGGTKRKLSSALALFGIHKSLLIMDEPATGMDPASRKHLWEAIKKFNPMQRASIITTHYVTEARSADRIGIMSKGTMKFIGSEREAQEENGIGYELSANLHIKEREGVLPFLKQYVFGQADYERLELVSFDAESGRAVVNVFGCIISPAFVYSRLFDLSEKMLVKKFSYGRLTLEHVFFDITSKEDQVFTV